MTDHAPTAFINTPAPAAGEITVSAAVPTPDPTRDLPGASPAPAAPHDAAAAPAPAPVSAPPPPALADLIADHRRAKEASRKVSQEADSLRSELAQLRAELGKSKAAKSDIMGDPIGYLRAAGIDDKELPLIGEAVMAHLMPDRAPPDLRARMLTAKMEREYRQREAAEQERRAQEAAAQNQSLIDGYKYACTHQLPVISEECPTSSGWFGEDTASYVESLVHTAQNMASVAEREGRQADLTPKNVARVLEEEISARYKRAGERQSKSAKPAAVAPAGQSDGKQASAVTPPNGVSAQALGGSPVPRSPATSEEERLRNAISVMERLAR